MKRSFFAAAALAVALLVTGCANVQKASQADSQQAKVFKPITDKAVIYVYRDEVIGAAIKMTVSVDGVMAGQTGPKSFLQLAVTPGHHTILSKSESDATLDIDAEAGKAYYVWQEVKIGIMSARSKLHLMSEAEGQAGVGKCELLKTLAPMFQMDSAAVAPAAPMPADAAMPAPAAIPAAAPVTEAAPAAPAAPVASAAPAAAEPSSEDAPAAAPVSQPAAGGIAALDDRVSKPMFNAAQDVASRHQCERLLRVRSINGDDAQFYSACPGTATPIEIACHGAACTEAAPHG